MSKSIKLNYTEKFPVVEMFHSIQGEGFHVGRPAFFIRFGGCDVCCNWCDEKVSWDESIYPLLSVEEIISQLLESGADSVVFTGGEPFRNNIKIINEELRNRKIYCIAETSGIYEITGKWDWLTLSPKEHYPPFIPNYKLINELKVVIKKESDFRWAESNALKVPSNVVLFLQPEWHNFSEIISFIIDYIKKNPKWRLSLQVHKFLNIP